ncbi:MAG: hypothetical protein LBT56_03960 [Prevotellaceae bacterium]|jgi:hypothetical protein|nr:hypothetical protein [Prevotellaceae bacterium]
METKVVKTATKKESNETKKKSKIALYWERKNRLKFKILDMRAILK